MNTRIICLLGVIARKESGNSFIKQVLFQGRLHSPKPRKNHSNNKIVFNLDHHPAFKNVSAIIRKHLSILDKSACMKEIFDPTNTRILTRFRRHKNVKELLSPASFPNTHKKQQPPPNAGCQKCKKKCLVCQNICWKAPLSQV